MHSTDRLHESLQQMATPSGISNVSDTQKYSKGDKIIYRNTRGEIVIANVSSEMGEDSVSVSPLWKQSGEQNGHGAASPRPYGISKDNILAIFDNKNDPDAVTPSVELQAYMGKMVNHIATHKKDLTSVLSAKENFIKPQHRFHSEAFDEIKKKNIGYINKLDNITRLVINGQSVIDLEGDARKEIHTRDLEKGKLTIDGKANSTWNIFYIPHSVDDVTSEEISIEVHYTHNDKANNVTLPSMTMKIGKSTEDSKEDEEKIDNKDEVIDEEKANLNKENEALKKSIEDLTSQLEATEILRKQLEDQAKRIKEFDQESLEMEDKNIKLQQQVEDLEEGIENLNKELEENAKTMGEQTKKHVKDLSDKTAEYKQKVDGLEKTAADDQDKIKRLQEAVQKLQVEKLNTTSDSTNENKDEIDDLKRQLAEKDVEADKKLQEFSRILSAEINEREEKIKNMEEELDQLKQNNVVPDDDEGDEENEENDEEDEQNNTNTNVPSTNIPVNNNQSGNIQTPAKKQGFWARWKEKFNAWRHFNRVKQPTNQTSQQPNSQNVPQKNSNNNLTQAQKYEIKSKLDDIDHLLRYRDAENKDETDAKIQQLKDEIAQIENDAANNLRNTTNHLPQSDLDEIKDKIAEMQRLQREGHEEHKDRINELKNEIEQIKNGTTSVTNGTTANNTNVTTAVPTEKKPGPWKRFMNWWKGENEKVAAKKAMTDDDGKTLEQRKMENKEQEKILAEKKKGEKLQKKIDNVGKSFWDRADEWAGIDKIEDSAEVKQMKQDNENLRRKLNETREKRKLERKNKEAEAQLARVKAGKPKSSIVAGLGNFFTRTGNALWLLPEYSIRTNISTFKFTRSVLQAVNPFRKWWKKDNLKDYYKKYGTPGSHLRKPYQKLALTWNRAFNRKKLVAKPVKEKPKEEAKPESKKDGAVNGADDSNKTTANK